MGRSLKYPIKSVRSEIQGKNFYSFFDDKGELFYPPTDYLIDMLENQAFKNSTVDGRASTLKVFFQYLSDKNIDYLAVDDVVLEEFRDSRLNTGKPNPRSNSNGRKISINVYLRRIYDFYKWVQSLEPRSRILGTGGHQINSTLLEKEQEQRSNYPKCYKGIGERSKHTVNFVPSQDDYTALFEHFLQLRPSVATRNTLMLMIIRKTGFRVGSLASLSIDQFDEYKIAQSTGDILICPEVQKFGYHKEFEVPLTLAYQILNYIKKDRQEIVDKYKVQSNKIFLSTTTGIPLNSKRISQMFNDAAKKLGWDKRGVGPHSWRRLFACEIVESDVDSSIELGLDTSIEAIGSRTAQKLGHNSILSQEAYIRYLKRKRQGSAISRLNDELQAEKDKNDRQAIELAELRRMLGKR